MQKKLWKKSWSWNTFRKSWVTASSSSRAFRGEIFLAPVVVDVVAIEPKIRKWYRRRRMSAKHCKTFVINWALEENPPDYYILRPSRLFYPDDKSVSSRRDVLLGQKRRRWFYLCPYVLCIFYKGNFIKGLCSKKLQQHMTLNWNMRSFLLAN